MEGCGTTTRVHGYPEVPLEGLLIGEGTNLQVYEQASAMSTFYRIPDISFTAVLLSGRDLCMGSV